MRFAQDTQVSVERSKGEIERILTRYGATEFASGWKSERAMMQFRMNDRIIRFVLPLPNKEDFSTTPSGRRTRSETVYLVIVYVIVFRVLRWLIAQFTPPKKPTISN